MLAVDVEIDVEVLKSEIKKTYASVSEEPEKDWPSTTADGGLATPAEGVTSSQERPSSRTGFATAPSAIPRVT